MIPTPIRGDCRFDEQRFTLWLRRLTPRLEWILASQKVAESDAEDLLQELFLSLLQRWQEIEDPERWLLAALRKKCIAFHRRRRLAAATRSAFSDDLRVSVDPSPRARRQELELAIAKLPTRQRTLLRLRYFEEMSPREVCGILSISPSSFQMLRRRALRRLRAVLIGRANAAATGDQPAGVAPPCRCRR